MAYPTMAVDLVLLAVEGEADQKQFFSFFLYRPSLKTTLIPDLFHKKNAYTGRKGYMTYNINAANI